MAQARMMTEEEITKGMLDGTEREKFQSALLSDEAFQKDISGELDDIEGDADDGDTSLEDMDDVPGEVEEGDDEPDDTEDEDGDIEDDESRSEDHEQDGEAPDTAPQGRERVPSSRLREETERRVAIENELANARARIAAYENEQRRSDPRAQSERQQAREEPTKPDRYLDPEGYDNYLLAQAEQRFTAKHVNATLGQAHREHGEAFVAAYNALTGLNPNDPFARATVQRIWDAPNPGEALMDWHNGERTRQEIGNDPEAWFERKFQERMRDPEARRAALENLRGEAMRGDDGRPRTQTRLPRSLNGAAGGGNRSRREADPELYNDSQASIFEYAMKD